MEREEGLENRGEVGRTKEHGEEERRGRGEEEMSMEDRIVDGGKAVGMRAEVSRG